MNPSDTVPYQGVAAEVRRMMLKDAESKLQF